MSSGDVTTYIRGKAQERYGPDATFMKDGFDRWAESDAPYRVGGAEKMAEEETGLGRSRRHRSSRAIHKYAENADEGMCGSGRRRGRKSRSPSYSSSSDSDEERCGGGRRRRARRSRRSPSSSSYSSSGSDMSSSSGSMSDSSSSGSEVSRPVGSARYRRRMPRRRGGYSNSDEYDPSDEKQARSTGRREAYGRRRRRRQRGGDDGKQTAYAEGYYDPSSRGSDSDSSLSSEERDAQYLMKKKAKDEQDARYSSGSESSSSSALSSSSSGVSAAGRRRRRHRGGAAMTEDQRISARKAINAGLDFWYKYAPNDLAFGGKPLANWTIVPDKIKEVVNKVNELWQMIEGNANNIASIKAVMTKKAPKVAEVIEKLGFGRRSIGRKLNAKLYKLLHKKARQLRRGGDKMDDKLASLSLLDKYNDYVKPKAPKFDAAVRPLYNAYAEIGDNADLIQSTINAIPSAPQAAKDVIKKVTDIAKQGRQMGLGKKGKRAPSQRNMMVSKLMREEGLTLGEASKKVSAMMKKGGSL
jgi:hypothetical protein